MIVTYQNLLRFCGDAFESLGFTKDDAAFVAQTLVDADAEGHHSHGAFNHLTSYVDRIQRGMISLTARPEVVTETSACAVIDGQNGMGQLVARFAVEVGIAKARAQGTAVVVVRNSNHYGRACTWTELAAREGIAAISLTNASPQMIPAGGEQRFLGTNPISIAVPAVKDERLVLDMATSVVALGKIQQALQDGVSIPEGWALDQNRAPTIDPAAALAGSVQFAGGYKGYGLSLLFDVLCSFLSGGRSFDELGGSIGKDFSRPTGTCHYFHFLSVAAFQEPEAFSARVQELKSRVKATGEGVLLPGEPEEQHRAQSLRHGIEIAQPTVVVFQEIAARLGIAAPVVHSEGKG